MFLQELALTCLRTEYLIPKVDESVYRVVNSIHGNTKRSALVIRKHRNRHNTNRNKEYKKQNSQKK